MSSTTPAGEEQLRQERPLSASLRRKVGYQDAGLVVTMILASAVIHRQVSSPQGPQGCLPVIARAEGDSAGTRRWKGTAPHRKVPHQPCNDDRHVGTP